LQKTRKTTSRLKNDTWWMEQPKKKKPPVTEVKNTCHQPNNVKFSLHEFTNTNSVDGKALQVNYF